MKEDNEMANKDKMEIQMKITMRHPYTLIKMTIKMIGSIMCWKMWSNWNSYIASRDIK